MDRPHFVFPLSTEGHLSGFQSLAVVNIAANVIYVHVSFFFFLMYMFLCGPMDTTERLN